MGICNPDNILHVFDYRYERLFSFPLMIRSAHHAQNFIQTRTQQGSRHVEGNRVVEFFRP